QKDSGLPLDEAKFGKSAWYPPGHGDFYTCIRDQGLLDNWLDQGKEILFISNSDNLGATVDNRILSYMAAGNCPFLMEVTAKTAADVKGGTLYQNQGRMRLLEVAQVPEQHMDDFCGTQKFNIFNTNNIWINLAHLRKRLREGPLELGVIVNPKSVDGIEAVQLETAMGAAIENFPGAVGLVVPRSRYLPVKRTSDLFLVQSDLFILEKGHLRRNPERKAPGLPLIEFGTSHAKFEDYQNRIPFVPSLIELESLVLDGDIWFEEGVTLKGEVALIHHQGRMTVAKGAVLGDNETLQ
ncbi:MAG: UTP--glucose-1-phosphate uridylyltransferase, partial [Nitrospinales bacterium]